MPSFSSSGYPRTAQFFAEDLRWIPRSKRKVHAAFETYSGLIGNELAAQFDRSAEPIVKVDVIGRLIGYTPPNSDTIYLAATFIRELEANLPPRAVRSGDAYAPSELEEKILTILEATVLHEMVHYWRMKRNGEARINAMSNRGRGFEERIARQFEKAAYGMIPSVASLGIERYMPMTAKL